MINIFHAGIILAGVVIPLAAYTINLVDKIGDTHESGRDCSGWDLQQQ